MYFRLVSISIILGAGICQLFLAMDALDKLFRFSEGWRIFWKILFVISFPIFRSVSTGAVFFTYFTGDEPTSSIVVFYLVFFFIPLAEMYYYSKKMNTSERESIEPASHFMWLHVYILPCYTCVFGVFTACKIWDLNIFMSILLFAVPLVLRKLLNFYDSRFRF